jgi:hypothetical protein
MKMTICTASGNETDLADAERSLKVCSILHKKYKKKIGNVNDDTVSRQRLLDEIGVLESKVILKFNFNLNFSLIIKKLR